MFRQFATLIFTTIFFLTCSSVARADDDQSSRFDVAGEGHASTAKKAVVVGLMATSAVLLTTSVVFFAKAASAESDRKDLILRNSGSSDPGSTGRDCTTAEQCNALADVKHSRGLALDNATYALVSGTLVGVTSIALALLWPNVKAETAAVRIAPTAMSNHGGGLVLEGRF